MDSGGWWWMVMDGGGWWWMVVDGSGWWWMVVDSYTILQILNSSHAHPYFHCRRYLSRWW